MKKIIKNLKELDIFVFDFLGGIQKKDKAIVVTLSGDLGAGKTALVKSAAKFFELSGEITSPTFVIQKEYDLENHDFLKNMIHIDAYRLEDKTELEYIGWNEIVQNPENIIFIEWPEQVEGIDIDGAIQISIKILDDESREIDI